MSSTATVPARAPIEIEVRPKSAGVSQDTKPERSFWQRAFGDDGLTFSTLLDVINPLQHIPVVSTIYREITGDRIAPGAKLIGDTLFGGPIGLALSAVDVTIQGETGKDMGQHVVAMLKPSTPTDNAIAVAAATPNGAGDDFAPEVTTTPAAPATAAAAHDDPAESPDAPKAAQMASIAPKPAPTPTVDASTYTPRSAFVAAAMKPRAPGNGINGSFVPLETRSTIAPSAMFAPVSLAMPSPRDEATKPIDKNVVALPDAKAVAANPDTLKALRANGVRPAPAQNATRGPSVTVPMPPPLPGPALASPADVGGASNDVGDVMARNLERYMALRNRRPAPSKVDRAL